MIPIVNHDFCMYVDMPMFDVLCVRDGEFARVSPLLIAD